MKHATGSIRLSALTSLLLLVAVGCGEEPQAPSAPQTQPSEAVSALPLSFVAVSAGSSHTCGITSAQVAYCWGDNGAGELGNGTTTASNRPVRVAGSLKFVQISAGTEYTCGIATTNFAYCWGSNSNGQLGIPFSATVDTRKPVAVDGGSRKFRQIRTGFNHTCAVNPFNVGFCWGKNQFGQLGANSTVATSTTPLRVAGGHAWERIVAGGHYSCGIDTSHLAWCWGNNDYGQLGVTTPGRVNRKPLAVQGGLHFRLIVAGGGGFDDEQNESPTAAHTCGVTSDDKGYCWGDSGSGELGAGPNPGSGRAPTLIAGDRRWNQVIAGWLHTCGVTKASVAFCWGNNFTGQNGNGSTNSSNTPVRVSGGFAFAAVTTGPGPELDAAFTGVHSCGLTTGNRVYCWGDNEAGQLGDGTNTRRLTPVAVVAP